jgi:O-antigen ligase
MTPAAPGGVLRLLLPAAVFVVLATLPFTWIHLARIGGFSMQLPYATAALLGAVLLVFPRAFATALRTLCLTAAPWLITYALYLLLLALSLAGKDDGGMIVRQVFYTTCGFTLALGLIALRGGPAVLRWGGLGAIAGFLLVTEVLARGIGLSWIAVVERLAGTGDLEFVFYQFLRQVFQILTAVGSEAKASDKNIVAVALFCALLLFRAGYRGAGADRFGQVVTVLAIAVLVALNTRSVLLVAAVALPLAAWIGILRRGITSEREFIFKSVVMLSLAVPAIVVLSFDAAPVALIGDRFSFSDGSAGGRVAQYAFALEQIERSPFWGGGIAEYEGSSIHNLFLGGWMHGGLPAFLCLVFLYLGLCATFVHFAMKLVTDPSHWALPLRPEWVAVLPLVPLFRVWISGDAGHPSYAGWLTLFAYAGLRAANALAQRGARERVAGPSAQPA